MNQKHGEAPISTSSHAQVKGVSATTVIVIIAVIMLFAISAVTYLIAAGRDPNAVVGLLTAIGAPTIVSLMALIRTDVIKRQTNGAMAAMHERMVGLEEKVPTAVNDPSLEMDK